MRNFLVVLSLTGALAPVSGSASEIIPGPYIPVVIDLRPSAHCEEILARVKTAIEEVIPPPKREVVVPLCLPPGQTGLRQGRIRFDVSYLEDIPVMSRKVYDLHLPERLEFSVSWVIPR